jgi:hypothetical protein
VIDYATVRDKCFGVNVQQQGRGYYVALELLAIIRGSHELGLEPLAADDEPPRLLRHSHDAARRLAAGTPELMDPESIDELGGPDLAALLGRLFRSIMVSIPGRRETGIPWQQLYLTPYVGELVHWDAVQRKRRERGAVIEEYSFRGVGAYAHRLLRTDPNMARLDETRDALLRAVSDGSTPLSVLARAASARDEATPTEATLDDEPAAGDGTPSTVWIEALRSGTHHIVTRDLPREKTVDLLMHWVPYAMARHILDISRARVGEDAAVVVVDFTGGAGPVRSLARRNYKDAATTIVDAMDRTCIDIGMGTGTTESDRRRKWGPARSFFTGSMSMIGALNAPVGSQFFTFGLPLLEAVVAALVPAGEQSEFSRLCDTLAAELGVVVDARNAASSGLLAFANASDFELNAQAFAAQLRSLGVLQDYSDSTQMVSVQELAAA